jgi:phage terminase small subunit
LLGIGIGVSDDRLSKKHQAFADEYLRLNMNGTQAYKNVYGVKGDNHAAVNSSRLLRNTKIDEYITERLKEKAMAADEVIARIAEVGRGDLSRYVTNQGEIDLEQLKADGLGHLLKKHKKTRRTIHQKNGDIIETEHQEIELYPADSAHDKLMRYHGLYNDKRDITSGGEKIIVTIKGLDDN